MFENFVVRFVSAAFWLACFRYTGTMLFLVFLLSFGWYTLGPKKPEADPARQAVANKAISQAINDLRRNRGDIKSAAVLHFRNDSTDYLTLHLRETLSSSGTFDVEDTVLAEKVRNLLSLRNPGYFSVEQAVAYGKKAEVQAVIIGNVETFESLDNGAVLTGTIRMVDVRTGKVVSDIALRENTTETFAAQLRNAVELPRMRYEAELMPWYLRFLIFVVIILLLPVITIAFLRQMVAKKSNGRNAFVLTVYTLIDAIIAFFMIGAAFESGAGVVLFLAATAIAFLYNVCMMTFALRLES